MTENYNEFDKIFNSEEFKEMTQEEKHEFVRNLIYKILQDSNAKAVLYNPIEQKSCSLDELINEIGEEKVIQIIINAIENASIIPQSFTKQEIDDAFTRYQNGTATESDKQKLMMLNGILENDEAIALNKNLTTLLVELIDFTQHERHFKSSLGDFLASFSLITTLTSMFSEDSSLSKYQNAGPAIVHDITAQVGKDILDTWKATCSEVPDDYMLMCALLHAAQSVANRIKLCDAKVYRDVLGDIIIHDDDICHCDNCDGECNCHDENSNGSNEIPKTIQPKTYSAKDQDMRNMLKE